MTDPNTPTQPTNNPQDLIDQALGSTPTPAVTPDPTPTLPVPEPLTPTAAVTEEAPMSTETVLPPTESVPTELTATPDVAPIMSEPPVDTKPMGEDMPLAFAGMPADVAADASMSNATAPVIEPVNNVVPPILTNPAPTAPVNKSKGAVSKVKMVVVAVLAFLGITGGVGLYAYQRYGTIEPATIAVIGDKSAAECNGCSCDTPGCGGGWLKMVGGQCKVSGICNSDKPIKDTPKPPDPSTPDEKAGSPGNCGTGYEWCGGGISKCVSFGALSSAGGGCNKYGEKVYGIPTTYGANPGKGACDPAKVASGLHTQCGPSECGGTETYCFDRPGSCNSTPIVRLDHSVVDTGMCGLVGSKVAGVFKEYEGLFNADGSLKYNYFCDLNGCQTSDASCVVVHYKCKGTVTGNSCTDSSSAYIKDSMTTGTSKTFSNKCGTVEQIDVTCGGYKTSRTRINPECTEAESTPNPSPTPTPSVPVVSTLMCSNLTRTPTTTPAVGDKVTFTCVGASVPAGSVNLSYKFRYSLNSGSYINLTNKTATTSELTIAACGNYSVECQACGTINGVLTCDPNWAGATTQ